MELSDNGGQASREDLFFPFTMVLGSTRIMPIVPMGCVLNDVEEGPADVPFYLAMVDNQGNNNGQGSGLFPFGICNGGAFYDGCLVRAAGF
jgi:hypothetical protein